MEEQKQTTGGGETPIPLTQTQHYWWATGIKNRDASSPHFTVALTLQGVLDMVALEQSVAEIMARHDILRSVFRDVKGTPYCFCLSSLAPPVRIEDLRGQIARVREENYQKIKEQEIAAAFNLKEGPLFRLLLICLGQGNWVLIASMHPILFDHWSVNLFFQELGQIYRACSKGEGSPLEPLPMQFSQFAAWQNERLKNNGLTDQRSYWRQQLKGFIAPLDLPVDSPRQTHGRYISEECCLSLPNPLSEGLAQFCQNGGHDLFCVLLAAFKVLAARHAGQTDILVGTPFSGRNEAQRHQLIGPFLNTLALRTQTEGPDGETLTFQTYLEQVEGVVEGARGHADLPFESLVSEGLIEKDSFHIFFELNGRTPPAVELTDLEVVQFETLDIEPEYDIYLHVDAMEQTWKCCLVYNANLFHRNRISEMLSQYKQLLFRIVEDSHRCISSYSLLTKKGAILLPNPSLALGFEWSGAFHQQFENQVEKERSRLALVTNWGTMSYGVLDLLANRIARRLTLAGLRKGDIVGIFASRGGALIPAIFGVAKAGGAFVLLDASHPAERLRKQVKEVSPKAWLLLAEAGFLPEGLMDCCDTASLCCLELPVMPDVDFLDDISGEPAGVKVGPDDLAYLAFTVCPAGREQVVEGLHGAPSHFSDWVRNTFRFNKSDRVVMLSGLSHHSLIRDIITPLAVGGSLHIPGESDLVSGKLPQWLAEHGITTANLTPGMGRILTSTNNGLQLSTLRQVFYMGETLTYDDLERLQHLAPGARVVHFYGATETQQALSWYPAPEPPPREEGSEDNGLLSQTILLGRGITDVQFLVLNQNMEMAGIGEVGALYIRSPYLSRGYLHGDDEERFSVNPFTGREHDRIFRTGDFGRYHLDGNVARVSDSDAQLAIHGCLVDVSEIEAVLESHEMVSRALVTGLSFMTEGGNEDTALAACIVPRRKSPESQDQLKKILADYVQASLPADLCPTIWLVMDQVPLTPCLRIDRQALRILISKNWKPPAPQVKPAVQAISFPMGSYTPLVLNHELEKTRNGESGHLYLGEPGLPRGYLNNPKLTAQKLLPNPFGNNGGARMLATEWTVQLLPDGTLAFLEASQPGF